MKVRKQAIVVGALCAVAVATAVPAYAQLDPLLFLKNTKPNVVLVVETTNRMQRDANNDYYDQATYAKGQDYDTSLRIDSTNTNLRYRRKYISLTHLDNSTSTDKFAATRIDIVGDLQGDAYKYFDARTRIGIARLGLSRALELNGTVARFGLIKTRQLNPQVATVGNEGPVKVDDAGQQAPTDLATGKWKIARPVVDAPDSSQTSITAAQCKADTGFCTTGGSSTTIANYVSRKPEDGGMLPAGADSKNATDTPIKFMLDDAQAEAKRLIDADSAACRNTVVVLVVGGGEGNLTGQDPALAASAFKSISGHRVPIYVIAIAPDAAYVSQLQAIAANSGGQYVEITKQQIETVPAGQAVPEFVRAVNLAVQHAFASSTDVNTAPTTQLPYGPSTEYQVTSPIVGTINLANAKDMAGNSLPNSVITLSSGNVIPQRSNVLLTTGFALPGTAGTPGFPGRLRAFRVYRPEPDSTKTSGYKFVGDGTPLWAARTPTIAEGARNIYTALPNGSIVAFTTANAETLRPYLNDSNPAGLIDYIRRLPLGAFVDSTPAVLDAPSLDPPPDSDYPAFVTAHKLRRTLIFIGGNDGMMHAIDGRTGVEVWAFIPANLLPKLRALREGLAVGKFQFTVDGSAKLADVKTAAGWRSYLVFGQGPGGTFYQAFDVTLDDMAKQVAQDSDDVSSVLGFFNSSSVIPFKWSFPNYASFDYTLSTSVTPYGDVKSTASDAEKTVGQTWSDPAVGEVQDASGNFVVMVGSGFLPRSQQQQSNRGDLRAGTSFYVIDAVSGSLLDSRDVGSDGVAESVDDCAAAGNCSQIKNALQSDPVATGATNSRFVNTAYVGDLDGRLWRFALVLVGGQARISSQPVKLYDAGASQPLFSSMAVVNVGGTKQYVFFGSGSDLLPSNGVSQAYKLFGVLDQGGSGQETFSYALSAVDSSSSDEKVSAYPAVAGDIVFFTTTTFYPTSPCTPPDSNLYALTFIGGAAYDNTGDNKVDKKDTPKVATLVGAGRATAPFVADQHLVLAAGGKIEFFGDPQDFNNGVGQVGVRILSWREVR